ncbi:DUF6328 family protein [Actinophytocola glycyrrhizae]|uniref:DUF6328 family protein n=1 Tax=Actinophytocola glycyrrhizae TaxID=2044873 RepID=A0ABV9SF71_9PSEU
MTGESDGSGAGTETRDERLTRNLRELLQEVRVAQTGVQFLFGFLLAVAFTERYAHASGFEQIVHLVAVVSAAASVALLTTPAGWHRLLSGKRHRPLLIQVGNRLTIAGLVCLAVTMTATVLLLFKIVAGPSIAAVVAVTVAVTFGGVWFLLPMRMRRDGNGAGTR